MIDQEQTKELNNGLVLLNPGRFTILPSGPRTNS